MAYSASDDREIRRVLEAFFQKEHEKEKKEYEERTQRVADELQVNVDTLRSKLSAYDFATPPKGATPDTGMVKDVKRAISAIDEYMLQVMNRPASFGEKVVSLSFPSDDVDRDALRPDVLSYVLAELLNIRLIVLTSRIAMNGDEEPFLEYSFTVNGYIDQERGKESERRAEIKYARDCILNCEETLRAQKRRLTELGVCACGTDSHPE